MTVNQSKSGLLLWAPSAIPLRNLLEVVIKETARTHAVSVVEVKWSALVRSTVEGQLHFPYRTYLAI